MVTIQIQFVVIAVGFEMQLALKGHMTPPYTAVVTIIIHTPGLEAWRPKCDKVPTCILI